MAPLRHLSAKMVVSGRLLTSSSEHVARHRRHRTLDFFPTWPAATISPLPFSPWRPGQAPSDMRWAHSSYRYRALARAAAGRLDDPCADTSTNQACLRNLLTAA